ncbi:MAG: hypothetical protein V7L13_24420, partial [Nostoc sp.]
FFLVHSQRAHRVLSFYIFSEMVNLPKLDAPKIRQLSRKIMAIGDLFRNIVGGKQKLRDEE